jgi:N-acetylglucosamine-6-phosphate deacetylase
VTSHPIRIGGGLIVTGAGLESGTVFVDDGLVGSIGSTEPDSRTRHEINAEGLIVAPGLIDLQINGGFGLDLLTEPDAMWELGRRLPCHGVTAFLPTIISSPAASTAAAIEALRRRPASFAGAEPLGLHFEGPMLNPNRRGAHQIDHLRNPAPTVIEQWSRRTGVAMVTIAPELPGAITTITELVRRGITVSAGHSDATKDESEAARRSGVTAVTHLFNAMVPLSHRDPNLLGVALAEDDLVCGLIVDGVHIDPLVVRAAWKAKGSAGIALVTDAVAAMGQPAGEYQLGGRRITADEHGVRNTDGTLAGSTLTMDQALRNLIAYTGCNLDEGLLCATRTPADLIGARDRGRLEVGTVADVVLLDRDHEVQITICAGHVAFVADDARDRVPNHLKES